MAAAFNDRLVSSVASIHRAIDRRLDPSPTDGFDLGSFVTGFQTHLRNLTRAGATDNGRHAKIKVSGSSVEAYVPGHPLEFECGKHAAEAASGSD